MTTSARGRRSPGAAPAQRKVGYAVIGLGHIAQSAVLPAFAHAKNSKLVALVSSDEEKRRKLSRRSGCAAFSDDDLDACLDMPEVDAAYIAEPNDRHAEFAVRCARKGVHVICEKPLAISEEECRRMIDACRDAGVKLMTAYRLHLEPSNLEVVRMIEEGRIGELRFFSSTFAYQVKPGNIRTSAERGGGAIWDLGVYCINAARYLFRADPTELFAMRADRPGDPRFEEVHEGMMVALRFPGDRLAQLMVSFGSAEQDQYRVVGTRGHLELDQAYAFSRAVLEDTEVEPDGEEGLRDVRIIVAALKSAREHRPLTLSWPARRRWPEPEDRIYRPPVREPRLIAAEPASQE